MTITASIRRTKLSSPPAVGFLVAATLTCAAATAQVTYVVDDNGGPGVDFTEIQDAVDVATAIDLIDVRQGSYSNVIISHPVRILGHRSNSPASRAFANEITVAGIAAGETVILTDLTCDDLEVNDCLGTVIMDGMNAVDLDINLCSDLRIHALSTGALASTRLRRVDIRGGSFVQMSRTAVRGRDGAGFEGEAGDHAVNLLGNSTLYMTDCTVAGGRGADVSGICWIPVGGDGGAGLRMSSSTARVMHSTATGGEGGYDCFSPIPSGTHGPSIDARNGSFVTHSESALPDGVWGGTVFNTPGLPAMTLTGDVSVAGVADFEVRAAASSSARVWVGRRAIVDEVPGLEVPRLHSSERGLSIGAMPATGARTLPFTIPALVPGTLIYAQASRTLPTGESELSNAVTLVVR